MATCQNQTSVGYQYDEGFAKYMVVPHKVLAADGMNCIPDGVGFIGVPVVEPFACVINVQEQLGIEPGGDMMVLGASPIDCLHVRVAHGVHRAGRIILVNINSEWLKMSANAMRPDVVINTSEVNIVEGTLKLTGGRGADVIIIATPVNITQKQVVSTAARNGRISLFGGLLKTNPTITLDSNLIHYRQLHVHGANGLAPEHNHRALDYVVNGEVPMADLITRRIRFRDMVGAFGIVERDEAIKVTVEP